MADLLVYDAGGYQYVGLIDETWFSWPAVAGGWSRRKRVSEPNTDALDELPSRNAELAVLLSGGDPEDTRP